MKKTTKITGLGIISALAASSCCIAHLLALILGSTSLATSFSWLEPARPYFIGFTLLVLAFVWIQKLKPKKREDCTCPTAAKKSFFQSTTALLLLTIFSGLMLAFPLYSSIFYSETTHSITSTDQPLQTVEIQIQGMTCEACTHHIKYEIGQLSGIVNTDISFANHKAIISFDAAQTSTAEIEKTIHAIGYQTQTQK